MSAKHAVLLGLRLVLLLLLLTASTAQATSDIIWRVHCKFPGEKEKPLKRSFHSTSSECWESVLSPEMVSECRAGNAAACDYQNKVVKECYCKPERMP
jgi:hypothetical protein